MPCLRHARDLQLGLAQVEREPAHDLHAGDDQRAAAGDDLEAQRLAGVIDRLVVEPADDQRLVRLGDPPHRAEQHDTSTARATTTIPTTTNAETPTMSSHAYPPAPTRSGLGDDHRARRIILDDDDPRADRQGDVLVDRVGMKVLAAASYGEHDLPDAAGTDRSRDAPDLSDDLVRDGLRLSAIDARPYRAG